MPSTACRQLQRPLIYFEIGSLHQQHRYAPLLLSGALRYGAQQGAGVGAQTACAHHDKVAVFRARELSDRWSGLADTSVFVGTGQPH